ncbi:MAG: caspase family protein, partial [Myxococcota bacterium]|nr:caspase family protein [Myxococcota bacterium]
MGQHRIIAIIAGLLACGGCATAGAPGDSGTRGLNLAQTRQASDLGLGTYRALIIGVNEYADGETWATLKAPVKDAEAVYETLTTRYGFAEEHTTLLRDEEATLDRVRAELSKLRKVSQPDDLVFVYYAGHGDYEEEFEGKKEGACWILHDGEQRGCTRNVLQADRVRRTLSKVKAKHLLLVADSCFAGGFGNRSGAADDTERSDEQYKNDLRLPSSLVLTSGDPDRTVLDQDGSGHSPFAKALLGALKYAPDDVGFVSARDLEHAVRTEYKAARLGYGARLWQLPDRPNRGGDFVFIDREVQATLRAARPDAEDTSSPAQARASD